MRDYEYLPAGQRKLAEQLDEEDFKREERTRELEESLKSTRKAIENVEEGSIIYFELIRVEENILEVLNKYN